MSKKSKLLIVGVMIAVLGSSSQALARGGTFHLNSYYQEAMAVGTSGDLDLSGAQSNASCSDQIASLQKQGPNDTAPQTVDGLTYYADLTRAEALDAEGFKDNCLMAVHRAAQDWQQ